MTAHTLIIAEAGVNHNGDMGMARALIDAAAEAGADLVKFQTFKSDLITTKSANLADYQRRSGETESQHAMLKRLELNPEMHRELMAHCGKRRIGFFSTGFDKDSIELLASLGLTLFKVPSGEITNLPYLRQIGDVAEEVILSTGMAVPEEIGAAIDALEAAGVARGKVTALHCTTAYPTPIEEVNLRAMLTIGQRFGVRIGYSDHTLGIEVPIAAVALGATVIEKHFTLDRTLPGPDHEASLEPDELKAMASSIRNIELALGDGFKTPTVSEDANRAIARKSLVAAKPISKGELFGEDNLIAKRPGTGISPMRWDEVVGRRAPRDFQADELIEI